MRHFFIAIESTEGSWLDKAGEKTRFGAEGYNRRGWLGFSVYVGQYALLVGLRYAR